MEKPQPVAWDMKTAAASCSLSVKTLDRAIRDGHLAVVRIGRKKLVMAADLEDFLKRHRSNAGKRQAKIRRA